MSKPNVFDAKAATWDENPEHVARSKTIAEAIAQEIPADRSLTAMEYGCGTGQVSFALQDRFAKITMIDTSPGMLDVLIRKIGQSGVTSMEAMNVDLLESPERITSTFSVIYSAMALHHIPDTKKLFSIWRSLLSPSGYLCIADLDLEDGDFHGPEFTGHKGFDRQRLKKIAESAGFADVKFKTVSEVRRTTNEGAVRSFPIFLMVCRKR